MDFEQPAVSDPDAFVQLPADQRVLTVLQIAGHTPDQIADLMQRHSHIGVLVNNLATCRDPLLKLECTKHRQKLEAELTMLRSPNSGRPWTVLEELDIIIAVAGDPVVPDRLLKAFERRTDLQAEPA